METKEPNYVASIRRLTLFSCFLQLVETRLHILCESVFGTFTNLIRTNGYGHHEILLFVHPRSVRFLVR